MWVAVTATTVVYRIGSRRKEELVALIGEAFLGWLVTDGYVAYRDHPRRQRCLAHLIRKGLALAQGYYGVGSGFGHELVRDLRRLIERVHDGDADTEAVKRLMARIKWNCQCNRHEIEKKVRDLAGEILNDWDAVVAFVYDATLPPTNNEAERALRHAVIARRISFGTRTDEGSRFYAAGLGVIDTCRKRRADPWAYACRIIAAARANLPLPAIPTNAAA
jgi:transposase